jgi:hypothetical protein
MYAAMKVKEKAEAQGLGEDQGRCKERRAEGLSKRRTGRYKRDRAEGYTKREGPRGLGFKRERPR